MQRQHWKKKNRNEANYDDQPQFVELSRELLLGLVYDSSPHVQYSAIRTLAVLRCVTLDFELLRAWLTILRQEIVIDSDIELRSVEELLPLIGHSSDYFFVLDIVSIGYPDPWDIFSFPAVNR